MDESLSPYTSPNSLAFIDASVRLHIPIFPYRLRMCDFVVPVEMISLSVISRLDITPPQVAISLA